MNLMYRRKSFVDFQTVSNSSGNRRVRDAGAMAVATCSRCDRVGSDAAQVGEVQEIRGEGERNEDELAGGLQLQWAFQAEFPNLARLSDGPAETVRPTDSCVVVFIEIAADLESSPGSLPTEDSRTFRL